MPTHYNSKSISYILSQVEELHIIDAEAYITAAHEICGEYIIDPLPGLYLKHNYTPILRHDKHYVCMPSNTRILGTDKIPADTTSIETINSDVVISKTLMPRLKKIATYKPNKPIIAMEMLKDLIYKTIYEINPHRKLLESDIFSNTYITRLVPARVTRNINEVDLLRGYLLSDIPFNDGDDILVEVLQIYNSVINLISPIINKSPSSLYTIESVNGNIYIKKGLDVRAVRYELLIKYIDDTRSELKDDIRLELNSALNCPFDSRGDNFYEYGTF